MKNLIQLSLIILFLIPIQTSAQEKFYEEITPSSKALESNGATIIQSINPGNYIVLHNRVDGFPLPHNMSISVNEINKSTGNILWAKEYRVGNSLGINTSKGARIIINNNNTGYIIVGACGVNQIDESGFVMEISQNGNSVNWTKLLSTNTGMAPYEVCTDITTAHNGYVLVGFRSNNMNVKTTGRTGFCKKIDIAGNFVWEKIFNLNMLSGVKDNFDMPESVITINHNGQEKYFITGSTNQQAATISGPANRQQVLATLIDDNGVVLWSKSIVDGIRSVGADAAYHNYTIYLLANSKEGFKIFLLDISNGSIGNTMANGATTTNASTYEPTIQNTLWTVNDFYANNIIVKNIAGNPHANDGAHIRVYGYATNFQSDPNCPISTFAPFVMDIPRYWVNPSSFTTKVFYKHPMTPGQNYGTILTAGSVHAPTIFTSDMAIENTTTNEYAIVGWNSTNNAPLSLLDNGNNAPCFDINGIGIVHNSTNPISTNFSWHSYVSILQAIITPNPANMSYILHDCTTSPLCLPPPAMRLVNVAVKENLFEFNVYPNPSNGEFNVNVSEDLSSDSEIIVRDILGKEIYKTMLTNKTIINLKDSPKGVYQITILNNGKTQTKKIILQ